MRRRWVETQSKVNHYFRKGETSSLTMIFSIATYRYIVHVYEVHRRFLHFRSVCIFCWVHNRTNRTSTFPIVFSRNEQRKSNRQRRISSVEFYFNFSHCLQIQRWFCSRWFAQDRQTKNRHLPQSSFGLKKRTNRFSHRTQRSSLSFSIFSRLRRRSFSVSMNFFNFLYWKQETKETVLRTNRISGWRRKRYSTRRFSSKRNLKSRSTTCKILWHSSSLSSETSKSSDSTKRNGFLSRKSKLAVWLPTKLEQIH